MAPISEYTGRTCKLLAQNVTLFFLVFFVFLNAVDHFTSPISEGTCVSADTCKVARMAPSFHLRLRQARHAGSIMPEPFEGESDEIIEEMEEIAPENNKNVQLHAVGAESTKPQTENTDNVVDIANFDAVDENLDEPPRQDAAIPIEEEVNSVGVGESASGDSPKITEVDENLDEPATQDAVIPPDNSEDGDESENLDLSTEPDEPTENLTNATEILSDSVDTDNEDDGESTEQEMLESASDSVLEITENSTDTATSSETTTDTNRTLSFGSWEEEENTTGEDDTTEGADTNGYDDYEEEGDAPAYPLDDPRPTYIPDPNDPSLEDIELDLETIESAMNETEGVDPSAYALPRPPAMPLCAPRGRKMRLQNVLTRQCIGLNPLGKLANFDCHLRQVLTFCVDPRTRSVKSANGRCLGTRWDRDAAKPAFLELVPCAINARSVIAQGYWRFGTKNRLINSGNKLCLDVWHNRRNTPVCSWYCKPDNGYKPQNQMWGFV